MSKNLTLSEQALINISDVRESKNTKGRVKCRIRFFGSNPYNDIFRKISL